MIVYRLTSPSGRQYVGQTRLSLKRRLSQHTAHAKAARTPIQRAVLKYGIEAFQVEALAHARTQEVLNCLEKAAIAALPADRYNLEAGGEGGACRPVSTETRRKMSEALKRYCATLPEEEMARRGRANKGVPKSAATRERMAEGAKRRAARDGGARTGSTWSPEQRRKYSETRKGSSWSAAAYAARGLTPRED